MVLTTNRSTGRARMEDVAQRAGVSMITVSRVLHNPEKVTANTRKRVTRAIRATGYVPNLVAGSLASNRTHTILALVPTLTNPVFGQTLHALEEALRSHGFHLLLGNSGNSPREEEALLATFLARRPDGIFLHSTWHTPVTRRLLAQARVPIVETGDLSHRPMDMVVSYSNFDAGKAITTYLLDKGYRRIGFVGADPRMNERARQRCRGYQAALRHAGVLVDPNLVIETTLGLRQGAEAIASLLERRRPVQAVFFAGDVWAVGALLECKRRDWPVPQRVAIVGFDDQAMAAEVIPPLTTVRVPRAEIGRRAAEMLLDRLRGKSAGPRKKVDLGFRIVARASG
jgi:LacI family transcriptional regulator, gluconate utilization system Gnt-I transcriptional repressor